MVLNYINKLVVLKGDSIKRKFCDLQILKGCLFLQVFVSFLKVGDEPQFPWLCPLPWKDDPWIHDSRSGSFRGKVWYLDFLGIFDTLVFQIPCEQVFGPTNTSWECLYGVQTPTHKVFGGFGRLGIWGMKGVMDSTVHVFQGMNPSRRLFFASGCYPHPNQTSPSTLAVVSWDRSIQRSRRHVWKPGLMNLHQLR